MEDIRDSEMYGQVMGFTDQIQSALDTDLGDFPEFENVCVYGIGASVLAGEILADYTGSVSDTFIPVIRGMGTPRWVTSRTLAIIISYSGNTHETLIAYKQVKSRGAKVVVITSDGELLSKARESNDKLVLMPTGLISRGALGYMIGYMANIVQALGICNASDELRRILPRLRDLRNEYADPEGEAAEIAERLYGKIPVVYSPSNIRSAALRWKTQINENCKTMGFDGTIPEFNHNEIIAWTDDKSNNMKFTPVILYDDSASEELRSMTDASMKVVSDRDIEAVVHHFDGENNFEKNLACMMLGDFVTLFLAEMYGVDPSSDDLLNNVRIHMD